MRPLALLAALGVTSLALAVGPPVREPAEVTKAIAQLADDDAAVRKAAMKRLEAIGEPALPALRRAAAGHADADVRLRAGVVARTIHTREWGLVKAFGPGASQTTPGSGYWFNRVRFTPDGKHALVAGGGVILFDLATGKEVKRVLEVNGARPVLHVAPDGKHVLTGHNESRVHHLLEVPTLKVARTFETHAYGAAFTPDGASAAVNINQEELYLVDLKTGKQGRRLRGHEGSPRSLAFSPDGKHLLVGVVQFPPQPTQNLLLLYDVSSGKSRSLLGHTGDVTGVAFRDRGRQVVSASADGTLRVWDAKAGKELRKMTHGGRINDLAVSPDGRRALTAGYEDRLVKVWDLETGRLLETFERHMGRVLGVAFAPDGRRALSCDAVACVRLWKLGR